MFCYYVKASIVTRTSDDRCGVVCNGLVIVGAKIEAAGAGIFDEFNVARLVVGGYSGDYLICATVYPFDDNVVYVIHVVGIVSHSANQDICPCFAIQNVITSVALQRICQFVACAIESSSSL